MPAKRRSELAASAAACPARPVCWTPKKRARQLNRRVAHAAEHGCGTYSAVLAHVIADDPLTHAHHDPFQLALLLAVFLLYLYTGEWFWVLIVFLAYYALENVVYFTAPRWHSYVGGCLHVNESRINELILDPIVFVLALLGAVYILDYSVFQLAVQPVGAWRTLLVLAPTVLAAFSDTYAIAWLVHIAAIWIVYATLSGGALALTQALAATIAASTLYAWFLRPINNHFVFNSLYAVLYGTFFAALLTGIAVNE